MVHAYALLKHADQTEIGADLGAQEVLDQADVRRHVFHLGQAPRRLLVHLPGRADGVRHRNARAPRRHHRADCRRLQPEPLLRALRQHLALRNVDRLHAANAVRSVQRHGPLGRGQRLEIETPPAARAVIGDRPVKADDPLVRLPRNRAQADRISRVDVLRQPARHRLRSLHIGHQQEEVRLRAVPLHRRQQQLDPQPPSLRFQVVRLVHHHQRERALDLPVADHQRQLLRCRDQDVEGPVRVGRQLFLERVHLDGGGQLFDSQPDRRGRRFDSRLEMLVQRAKRIARLALQHVARERLGRLRLTSESGTLSTHPVLSGFSPMAFPPKAICNRSAVSTAC